MRASRLLSLLMLLQTRGRMTAQALADELEVSVRTVYRDIDSLGVAGVPIYADRGPAGGYQLLDGYRTRLTGLTADEVESLFLAGIPGPAAELGLGTVLAAAELKLLAALPPELRSRAGRIRERFHLDAPGWFREADRSPHLAAVADAVWNQRPLRVRYRRWRGEVTRALAPIGLVLKGGAWYLVAAVVGKGDEEGEGRHGASTPPSSLSVSNQVRAYRVSRMLAVEAQDGRFERPEGFDLAAFWRSWSEQFQANLRREQAVVRLSPRGLALLQHLFDPVTVRAANASAGPPDAEGWTRVVLPVESIEHAEVDLLRLGAEAEVLDPPDLRERMAETTRAMRRIYGP